MPPRSRLKWIALAALLLIVGALAAATLALRADPEAINAAYNATSADLRDRDYARPPSPGITFTPGMAAERYRRALNLAKWTHGAEGAAQGALDAAAEAPLDAPPPIPAACLAIGAPEASTDPVAAHLDEALCAAIADMKPALDALIEGASMQDARSPIHAWSDPINPSPALKLIHLARFAALRAHLRGLSGDIDSQHHDLISILRFGHDLTRGGGLLATMVGVAAVQMAADALARLLEARAFDLDGLKRLQAELRQINLRPMSAWEAYEAEYVLMAALFLEGGDVLRPPGALSLGGSPGLLDKILNRGHTKDQSRLFEAWRKTSTMTWEARRAALAPAYAEIDASINPTTKLMNIHWEEHDLEITATASALALLEVYARVEVHAAENGRLPQSLDALDGPLPLDPLNGLPFALQADPLGVELRSVALDGDERDPKAADLLAHTLPPMP